MAVTRRPGFALALALLLLVVLAGLGAAMLALGAREAEVAAAMARRSIASADAESAVRLALATWSTRRYRSLQLGESTHSHVAQPTGEATGLHVSVTITRLHGPLFFVEALAPNAHGTGHATGRAGVLVRTFDPHALATAFPAAVVAGDKAVIHGGTVSGVAGCGEHLAPPIHAPASHIGPEATVDGATAVVMDEPPIIPAPDPFRPPAIDALATITSPGGTLAPQEWLEGAQDTLPLVHVMGDGTVIGGQARGLLLAAGDLRLAGLRFDGVILVHGRLVIDEDTSIRGAVRARTVDMRGGAVLFDSCAVLDALAAGGLDRPFRPPGRAWIPVF